MPTYRTPGVYFEWLDASPAVRAVRTDIAGFVGIAERGPLHTAVKVESWDQFTSIFGAHIPQGYLAYAVEGFFANGGATCWIVRAADPETAHTARVAVPAALRERGLTLKAASPGVWGKEIRAVVITFGADRFSLTLEMPGGSRETWQSLSLTPGDPRYFITLMDPSQPERLARLTRDVNAPRDKDPALGSRLVSVEFPDEARVNNPPVGADGLKGLTPAHLTGVGAPENRIWGLKALEDVDEVAIVAIPDIMPSLRTEAQFRTPPPRCQVIDPELFPPLWKQRELEFPPVFDAGQIAGMQAELIGQCEKLKDRVAVLDPRREDQKVDDVVAWRRQRSSTFAALYFPWLRVPDPLTLSGLLREIPPSGHVAGVYARSDRQTGVHKPPANELVEDAEDVTVPVGDIGHGILNDDSVNLIRNFNGRGLRIFGARTLASRDDRQLLFINVRRLLLMIAESIDESTQWTVFEPNSDKLRQEIDRVTRGFLDRLWQRGMLDGASAEEAYSVRCDASNNPPSESERGRVICDLGVQPPWPAEFVVVRIGKTATGVEILNAMEAQSV